MRCYIVVKATLYSYNYSNAHTHTHIHTHYNRLPIESHLSRSNMHFMCSSTHIKLYLPPSTACSASPASPACWFTIGSQASPLHCCLGLKALFSLYSVHKNTEGTGSQWLCVDTPNKNDYHNSKYHCYDYEYSQ